MAKQTDSKNENESAKDQGGETTPVEEDSPVQAAQSVRKPGKTQGRTPTNVRNMVSYRFPDQINKNSIITS